MFVRNDLTVSTVHWNIIMHCAVVGLQNEGHSNKEAGPVLWSPFEILNSRIVDSDVKPTYRIIGTDVTSYKTVYNYSCTLYGLYGRYRLRLPLQQDPQTRHTYSNSNHPVVFYFDLNRGQGKKL